MSSVRQIEPVVAPRVLSPLTGDPIPLVDAILDLSDVNDLIRLVGEGKSTALNFLKSEVGQRLKIDVVDNLPSAHLLPADHPRRDRRS